MAWTVLLAVLGVCLAIPMKKQMINVEQLPFPQRACRGCNVAFALREGRRGGKKGQEPGDWWCTGRPGRPDAGE